MLSLLENRASETNQLMKEQKVLSNDKFIYRKSDVQNLGNISNISAIPHYSDLIEDFNQWKSKGSKGFAQNYGYHTEIITRKDGIQVTHVKDYLRMMTGNNPLINKSIYPRGTAQFFTDSAGNLYVFGYVNDSAEPSNYDLLLDAGMLLKGFPKESVKEIKYKVDAGGGNKEAVINDHFDKIINYIKTTETQALNLKSAKKTPILITFNKVQKVNVGSILMKFVEIGINIGLPFVSSILPDNLLGDLVNKAITTLTRSLKEGNGLSSLDLKSLGMGMASNLASEYDFDQYIPEDYAKIQQFASNIAEQSQSNNIRGLAEQFEVDLSNYGDLEIINKLKESIIENDIAQYSEMAGIDTISALKEMRGARNQILANSLIKEPEKLLKKADASNNPLEVPELQDLIIEASSVTSDSNQIAKAGTIFSLPNLGTAIQGITSNMETTNEEYVALLNLAQGNWYNYDPYALHPLLVDVLTIRAKQLKEKGKPLVMPDNLPPYLMTVLSQEVYARTKWKITDPSGYYQSFR